MALIQGMRNANKTGVRFVRCSNGGFLEGAGPVPFAHFSLMTAFGGIYQYSSSLESY
jgi:hypothetical protein